MYSEYVSTAFDTSSPACAAAGGGSLTTSPGGISWPQTVRSRAPWIIINWTWWLPS